MTGLFYVVKSADFLRYFRFTALFHPISPLYIFNVFHPVRGKLPQQVYKSFRLPKGTQGLSRQEDRLIFFREGILSLIPGKAFGESGGLLEFTGFQSIEVFVGF